MHMLGLRSICSVWIGPSLWPVKVLAGRGLSFEGCRLYNGHQSSLVYTVHRGWYEHDMVARVFQHVRLIGEFHVESQCGVLLWMLYLEEPGSMLHSAGKCGQGKQGRLSLTWAARRPGHELSDATIFLVMPFWSWQRPHVAPDTTKTRFQSHSEV